MDFNSNFEVFRLEKKENFYELKNFESLNHKMKIDKSNHPKTIKIVKKNHIDNKKSQHGCGR